jgi:hypothetical protein
MLIHSGGSSANGVILDMISGFRDDLLSVCTHAFGDANLPQVRNAVGAGGRQTNERCEKRISVALLALMILLHPVQRSHNSLDCTAFGATFFQRLIRGAPSVVLIKDNRNI